MNTSRFSDFSTRDLVFYLYKYDIWILPFLKCNIACYLKKKAGKVISMVKIIVQDILFCSLFNVDAEVNKNKTCIIKIVFVPDEMWMDVTLLIYVLSPQKIQILI